jgi:hypothetical protein
MMKAAISIILISFISLSIFCKRKPNVSRSLENKSMIAHNDSISTNDTLLQFINEWKKDSLGCLKLRTKAKAEVILQFLKKDTLTKRIVYYNFGIPNELQHYSNNLILIYYFDCACNNNKLIVKSDKCYAKFYFQNDTFKEIDYVCE